MSQFTCINSQLFFSTNHKALICVICYPILKKIFGSVLCRVTGLPLRIDYLTVTVKSALDYKLSNLTTKAITLFSLFYRS